MAFWWVNHKKTRDHEVRGGYLWSPMRNANGAFNQSYENMKLVRPGDVVFSYANGYIAATGQVIEGALPSPKPTEFGGVGDYWSNEGWLVTVYFSSSPKRLRPKEHMQTIAPMLPAKYSPLQKNGDGNQVCYLAGVSDSLGYVLLVMLGIEEKPEFTSPHFVADPEPKAILLDDLHALETDASLAETQRLQLLKARIGQGLFRKRVMLIDPSCRVTGVDDPRLVIASHIKPWRESNNAERISGFNGIMLSPHIDALFDEHLMSFENNGRMMIHPSLPDAVLDRWSIAKEKSVGAFMPEQIGFLEHHRNVFAKKAF